MKRAFVVLTLIITFVSCFAEDNFFPIGPWGISLFYTNNGIDWAKEKEQLMNLNVNNIEGATGPNDSLWIANVCAQSDNKIKITTGSEPPLGALWHVIRGWADQGYLPYEYPSYDYSIREHIDRAYALYANDPNWSNAFFGHECSEGGWGSVGWDVYYTATEYAMNYWRQITSNDPRSLSEKATVIMPIRYMFYAGTTMNNFASKLNSIGILENDCYEINVETSPRYDLNSSGFFTFQYMIDKFVQSADSCFKYYEKPRLDKTNTGVWYSIFQTSRIDKPELVNGKLQWVEKLRYPTKEEIRLQAWLALSRGAKGLKYYAYLSSDPGTEPMNTSQEATYGILTEKRVPRTAVIMDPANNFPDSAKFHIYDWVKELNDTMHLVCPIMANLQCQYSFGVNHPYGVPAIIEDMSASNLQITKVVAANPDYAQYDYFEVGTFKDKARPDYDYLMVVSRYCQPADTVDVSVTFKYSNPFDLNFFLVDAVSGQPVSGELDAFFLHTISLKIVPGGGRLLKFIPYTSKVNLSAYTNFRFIDINSDLNTPYTKDSINIVQKYWTYNAYPETLMTPASLGHWETVATGWQPFSDKVIQYLKDSEDDNVNEFEVQFKIGGKYYTPKVNSNILFDDEAPVDGAVVINDGQSYTNDTCVFVKVNGADQLSGIKEIRYDEFPFDNPDGYANLIKNGDCKTETDWILDNAVYENGYIHLLGENTGPGPVQTGSYAKQVIPGEMLQKYSGKLLRLKDDIYSHNVIMASRRLDLIYADDLSPSSKTFLDKSIASATGSLWKTEWDTFTLKVDDNRPISRMELTYYINQIEVPPPLPGDDPTVSRSSIPNPLALDNVFLEPVEFFVELPDTDDFDPISPDGGNANIPDTTDTIFDGWFKYSPLLYSYVLSQGDGPKIIYAQLRDNAANENYTPGWVGSIILDMTKPYAKINSPDDNVYINGSVTIYGSFSDLNFDKWILEYKKLNDNNWLEMIRSGVDLPDIYENMPSTALFNWNTESTDDGVYLLRLTSYDKAGNYISDTNYVYVCNIDIPNTSIISDFVVFNSLPVDGTTDTSGNIYATDTQDDKIWKFSPEGDSLLCFGYKYTCKDTLGLNHPKGIAVDDSGFIWVTDCYQSKLKKYDNQGNYICTIGKHGNKQGEFNQPTGVAIKGDLIYVSDHLNNRVQVFNRNGTFVRQFGENTLKQPAGIAINGDGKLYVSDSKNNRIVIFDDLGNITDSLGCEMGLREPWDICFDCNNNLYIADVYNNQVVQLDAWGNTLLVFGKHGSEAGQFKLPQGLAVSPDGKYLYVIDTHNDRIQRFQMSFDIGTSGPMMSDRKKDNRILSYSFMLGQSYPNPTAFKATIEYALPKEAKVRLNIYNTLGQKVRTMVNETQKPGYYSVNWDKKDDSGNETVAGVYFYRLEAGENSATKKMVIIK